MGYINEGFDNMSKYKSGALRRLHDKDIISPPSFVSGGLQYETIMGSMAYGVSSDASDMDIYGFCIPPKDIIFPHLAGHIKGFGRQKQSFDQWVEHHIKDEGRIYDISIFNIVKYFHLCMDNNPNMIDSLFTASNMVISSTKISDMVRDQRKIFLHKGAWHRFKGYAYGQMKKLENKKPVLGSVRAERVKKHGFDSKFAYHSVRLLDEVEQIMTEGDIDLMRNREQLKAIRRGDWSLQDIKDHFIKKEKELETIYTSSKLQYGPDEKLIKQLLIDCLEEYYGNLDKCVVNVDEATTALQEISDIIKKRGF